MIIKLIVGLGNPGADYADTRHNAGAWLVEQLCQTQHTPLTPNKKLFGLTSKIMIDHHPCYCLIPTTFMNHSGRALAAITQFYKIPVEAILVAYDDLAVAVGDCKLKVGGGHGGHKGLQNIIQHLGSQQFMRLRIGIGHPGHKDKVADYVLNRPSASQTPFIQQAINRALTVLPLIIQGDLQKAMTQLHTQSEE